jgi:hypothetical protein
MGKYSSKDVTYFIREGIRSAERDYSKASGVPLWEGPEYLITVYIFQSLLRRFKEDCLTLELKPTVADEWARKATRTRTTPRRPSSSDDERPSGHCDAVLWRPNKNITLAVIEVKKSAKDCQKDIDRVIGRLRNGLEFGVLASPLYVKFEGDRKASARRELLSRSDALAQSIKKRIDRRHEYEVEPERGNITETNEFDEDDLGHKVRYLWCPVTFLISEKQKG